MISKRVTEMFQQARQDLNDNQVQQIDVIWKELEGEIAAIASLGDAEKAESENMDKIEEAEKQAVKKLILYLQEEVDQLKTELASLKQEHLDLERKERFLSGAKIYPNEPCPCGSGKKYKKCCGLLADRAQSPLAKETDNIGKPAQ